MKLLIRVLEVPMAEILPVSNVLDPFEGRSLSLNDNFPTCWINLQSANMIGREFLLDLIDLTPDVFVLRSQLHVNSQLRLATNFEKFSENRSCK